MDEGVEAVSEGRALAARRRQVRMPCRHCGREMVGLVTRRYCSSQCRLRALRARRQAARATVPPLVQHLDRVRDSIMRGREFDDSTEILRQLRAER